jgi:hypothetical protein
LVVDNTSDILDMMVRVAYVVFEELIVSLRQAKIREIWDS